MRALVGRASQPGDLGLGYNGADSCTNERARTGVVLVYSIDACAPLSTHNAFLLWYTRFLGWEWRCGNLK